ncbi:hypothetical protein K501DRAFT_216746 [Backusella circina FSU 941]|nr:hypothetical protein K501DRAFT_216746 [Backusella circina FSU 941]
MIQTMSTASQSKRKNDTIEDVSVKRPFLDKQTPITTNDYFSQNTPPSTLDSPMEESTNYTSPPRPSTPPLGMTLAHYDANTGTYSSSVIKSHHAQTQICTGMTPVYRPPFERWGSCLI